MIKFKLHTGYMVKNSTTDVLILELFENESNWK